MENQVFHSVLLLFRNFHLALPGYFSTMAILSLTDKGFKYLDKYKLILGFIEEFEL
jgi:hypothetical protein